MPTRPTAINSHVPLRESYLARSQDCLHSSTKISLEFHPLTLTRLFQVHWPDNNENLSSIVSIYTKHCTKYFTKINFNLTITHCNRYNHYILFFRGGNLDSNLQVTLLSSDWTKIGLISQLTSLTTMPTRLPKPLGHSEKGWESHSFPLLFFSFFSFDQEP